MVKNRQSIYQLISMQLLVVFLMLILNLFINAIYWEHRGTNKLRLKMKTFRLIGMALLAVVMCVNFASCSSDDDEKEISASLEGTWYYDYGEGW